MTLRVFDFFSGCGGTSCGFSQAGLDVALGLDLDEDAARTFQANHPKADFMLRDIQDMDVEEIAPLRPGDGPILFSGCAPCQPFSKQSRRRNVVDPRRSLLAHFGRFVRRWQPEYVFVENVPGMQRVYGSAGPLADFLSLLSGLGYGYDSGIVAASSFGVPQTRERFVLLAVKGREAHLPSPTHGIPGVPTSTVRDWIGGLAPIAAGETHPDDLEHRAMRLSDINLARIRATPEGGGRENWPSDLKLRCHVGHNGHSDVYGRLAWSRTAAALTTRCISYSNGRFGHPEQHRAISVREAACLQTFPKEYTFSGSIESKARQIGNAVPPIMAEAVGRRVMAHLRSA